MILGDKQQTRPGLDKSISKLSMLSSGSAFSSSQLQVNLYFSGLVTNYLE